MPGEPPDPDLDELMRLAGESDLLRLSTAGSVDDGKSTLIGRLLHDSKGIYDDQLDSVRQASASLNRDLDLALLTDGLRAEREQGITIDVAYRYFSTPRRRFIIADTPGHEQYTRNMATGASTANLALLLVDARKGLLIQSKRHAFLSSLLRIPHMVVCVNKMDLVEYSRERFEEIREAFGQFAAKLDIRDIAYIPVSALHGDNVVHGSERMSWYGGPPLLHHLENVYVAGDRNLIDFRFPVQLVNRPHGDYRGFCGTVASGVVRVGDEVVALPSHQRTRVRAIDTYEGEQAYAFAPQAVTLRLEDEIDLSRGDMLAHRLNLPRSGTEIEAMLVWMAEAPMRPGTLYGVKHTTRSVRGAFTEITFAIDPAELHRKEAAELHLNEIGRVRLELHQSIAYDEYARNRATGSFIVMDLQTNRTVGAGMIIDRPRESHAPAGRTEAPSSRNITQQRGAVSPADRQRLLRQQPATLWLTGLSGSGKSTLGFAVEKRLIDQGHACVVLDGDNLRHGLNRDLGFSPSDRTENIRRVAEVARLFNDAGLIVITSFISPYARDRQGAREIVGADRFAEVFVDAPLDVCEGRDPRGLYKKARAGEITGFTGVSAPYEAPRDPAVHIRTDLNSLEASLEQIFTLLRRRFFKM